MNKRFIRWGLGKNRRPQRDRNNELIGTGISNPNVDVWTGNSSSKTSDIHSRFSSKNPVMPISDPIVWSSNIQIDDNIVKDGSSPSSITVRYSFLGKGFPALESFIEDVEGTKIFIGAYVAPNKEQVIVRLSGNEFQVTNKIQIKIETDKKGSFLGVVFKDAKGKNKTLSPAAYNKMFTTTSAAADLKTN